VRLERGSDYPEQRKLVVGEAEDRRGQGCLAFTLASQVR
jgi:hypothetical protein